MEAHRVQIGTIVSYRYFFEESERSITKAERDTTGAMDILTIDHIVNEINETERI